mmetsp:Transcript_76418/g.198687  ORF Transcript_76418/g.198687 Transcript_76418/m.198687 type:complete len:223 (-) Transcript_76418:172-840(-)
MPHQRHHDWAGALPSPSAAQGLVSSSTFLETSSGTPGAHLHQHSYCGRPKREYHRHAQRLLLLPFPGSHRDTLHRVAAISAALLGKPLSSAKKSLAPEPLPRPAQWAWWLVSRQPLVWPLVWVPPTIHRERLPQLPWVPRLQASRMRASIVVPSLQPEVAKPAPQGRCAPNTSCTAELPWLGWCLDVVPQALHMNTLSLRLAMAPSDFLSCLQPYLVMVLSL